MVNMRQFNQEVEMNDLLDKQRAMLENGEKHEMVLANLSSDIEIRKDYQKYYHVTREIFAFNKNNVRETNVQEMVIPMTPHKFGQIWDKKTNNWVNGITNVTGYKSIVHDPTKPWTVTEEKAVVTRKPRTKKV
jgi:hypothetical protein